MKQFKEYPATHSMSTAWFAIDDEGKVAILNFEDNGPIPQPASGSQTCCESLIKDGLDDSCGFKYRIYTDEQALAMFRENPNGFEELFGKSEYFWGVVQIDILRTDEFLKIVEPLINEKYSSIICYSKNLGIYSFTIDKYKKVGATILAGLKSSGCIIKVLDEGYFDYDFIDDEEEQSRLSPIPFVVYNQEYGHPFGDLNKVYSPEMPQFTENQLTDFERRTAIRIKGRFADLAHIQPAANSPFDTYEYLERVDVDGQPYYKMRLTGNTDEQAYVYDSLTSGLKTDHSYCEKCPLYEKTNSSYRYASYVRGWEQGNHPTVATIGVDTFKFLVKHPELEHKTFETDIIQCGFSSSLYEENAKRAKEVGMENVLNHCKYYFEQVLKIFRPYILILEAYNKDLLTKVYPHSGNSIEINGEIYPFFMADAINENLDQIMEFANKPYRGKVIPKVLSVEEAERIGVKVER